MMLDYESIKGGIGIRAVVKPREGPWYSQAAVSELFGPTGLLWRR